MKSSKPYESSLDKFLNNNTILCIYYYEAANIKLTPSSARMKFQMEVTYNAINPERLKIAKLSFYDELIKDISKRKKAIEESMVSENSLKK